MTRASGFSSQALHNSLSLLNSFTSSYYRPCSNPISSSNFSAASHGHRHCHSRCQAGWLSPLLSAITATYAPVVGRTVTATAVSRCHSAAAAPALAVTIAMDLQRPLSWHNPCLCHSPRLVSCCSAHLDCCCHHQPLFLGLLLARATLTIEMIGPDVAEPEVRQSQGVPQLTHKRQKAY